jgi:hypothetical protein
MAETEPLLFVFDKSTPIQKILDYIEVNIFDILNECEISGFETSTSVSDGFIIVIQLRSTKGRISNVTINRNYFFSGKGILEYVKSCILENKDKLI